MSLFSWLQSRKPQAAKRPPLAVERLDDRLVPAVVFPGNPVKPFVANYSDGVLRFWDDEASSAIVIDDDGSYGVGNIKVRTYDRFQFEEWQAHRRAEPSQTSAWVAPKLADKSFWKVVIDDAGGSDKILYNLPNGVRDGVYHEVDVRLDTAAEGGVAWGGGGHDEFKATVNGMGFGAGLRVLADGYVGNDRLEVEVHGTLRRESSLGVSMTGGYGADDIGVDAWDSVVIESGALLWANLDGFGGQYARGARDFEDVVGLWYLGRMDGRLQYNLWGGDMGDSLMVNFWANAGSRGSVGVAGQPGSAAIHGQDGHDHIYMYVRGANVFWFSPTVNGGSGTDTFHRVRSGESLSFLDAIRDNDRDDNRGPVRRVDELRLD